MRWFTDFLDVIVVFPVKNTTDIYAVRSRGHLKDLVTSCPPGVLNDSYSTVNLGFCIIYLRDNTTEAKSMNCGSHHCVTTRRVF